MRPTCHRGDATSLRPPTDLAWLYRPQIAVLGIGGARLGPVTMTGLPPAEAAIAAAMSLGVHTVIPVHYPPGDQLAADLAGHDQRIQVATLEFGET